MPPIMVYEAVDKVPAEQAFLAYAFGRALGIAIPDAATGSSRSDALSKPLAKGQSGLQQYECKAAPREHLKVLMFNPSSPWFFAGATAEAARSSAESFWRASAEEEEKRRIRSASEPTERSKKMTAARIAKDAQGAPLAADAPTVDDPPPSPAKAAPGRAKRAGRAV